MTSLRKTLDTTDFCKSRVRCAQLTGHWRTGGANLRTFLSGEAKLNRHLAMQPPGSHFCYVSVTKNALGLLQPGHYAEYPWK